MALPAPAPPRRGRRPAGTDTRAQILTAAREEFAAKGYDGASVRGIARCAEVDPALVHHYFGTKEQVFIAAMSLPILPASVVPDLLAGDLDRLGERVARFFFGVWDVPEGRGPFVGLLSSAATSDQAATMLRTFVTRTLLSRFAAGLPEMPERELRVALAASQLIGAAWLRYVVLVEPLASVPVADVVRLVAPAVQHYLISDCLTAGSARDTFIT